MRTTRPYRPKLLLLFNAGDVPGIAQRPKQSGCSWYFGTSTPSPKQRQGWEQSNAAMERPPQNPTCARSSCPSSPEPRAQWQPGWGFQRHWVCGARSSFPSAAAWLILGEHRLYCKLVGFCLNCVDEQLTGNSCVYFFQSTLWGLSLNKFFSKTNSQISSGRTVPGTYGYWSCK